jgi:hypothetical protein
MGPTLVDNWVGAMGQDVTGNVFRGGGFGSPLANGGIYDDPGMKRPYRDNRGIPCVNIAVGRRFTEGREVVDRRKVPIANLQSRGINLPVWNYTALRKEEWDELDRVVLRAARLRLRFWADLAAANSYGGFNGMGKMILEHETMSDPGEAIVDMSGITEGRTDAPLFQLQGLPLPITHSDFWFDSRRLAISRNSGTPLDTTMGEAAGRRVAESVEKVSIGVDTGITYGGNTTQQGGYGRASSVYGLINFPPRLTKTNGYKPTGVGRSGTGWVPLDTLKDILAAIDQLRLNKFYGPFMIYTSNDWDQYLDSDYFLTTATGTVGGLSTATLRNRLRMIDGVTDVRRLDFLAATAITTQGSSAYPYNIDPAQILTANPFTMILIQLTPEVARAVNGQDITTVQWETKGGMQLNFKVFCIQVPQLRSDFYGNCLSGDTKIVIRGSSTTALRDLVGRQIEVLNRHNKWETATVRSFGTQRLHQVNFQQTMASPGMNPVLATADHRWWQKDGSRIPTTKLKSIPFTEGGQDAEVTSIVDTGRDEEVFCCVVPGSESFTLANGLTTSNCGVLQLTCSN